MGQGELLKVLKKESRWLTSKEIAKITNVGLSSTRVKLKRLRISKMIDFKKEGQAYLYKHKE